MRLCGLGKALPTPSGNSLDQSSTVAIVPGPNFSQHVDRRSFLDFEEPPVYLRLSFGRDDNLLTQTAS
jgi:hypothetical protein